MFVLDTESGASPSACGNKGRSLAAMHGIGIRIPRWIAVDAKVFYHSLSMEQSAALRRYEHCQLHGNREGMLSEAESIFANFAIAKDLNSLLESAMSRSFAPGTLFAVRSSSSEEDSFDKSFAGQFESFLFVPWNCVLDHIVKVWQSAFSRRVSEYRLSAGRPTDSSSNASEIAVPAVLIQEMVDADFSGVAFSADPVTGSDAVCVIEAVYGVGEGLVGCGFAADCWTVDIGGLIIEERIADKTHAVKRNALPAAGTVTEEIAPIDRNRPCLNADQVKAIATLARRAHSNFGGPQDIEWCIKGDDLFLLQARPITTLGKQGPMETSCEVGADSQNPEPVQLSMADVDVWDCSNICESYPGVTTPLTFSFARKAYEHVYREFLKIMGVSSRKIEDASPAFPRMLGLVRGRIYYNLPSWFTLLSLLPGFGSNAEHMQTMMGLKEPLPPFALQRIHQQARKNRAGVLETVLAVGSLLLNLIMIKSKVAEFYVRVEEALGETTGDTLNSKTALELGREYRLLEQKLLKRWDAPIINDFFAMIFYGMLRKLCQSWCRDLDGSLQNTLIAKQSGIISAEPAMRIKNMGALAKTDAALVDELRFGSLEGAMSRLQLQPALKNAFEDYLNKFGDRCMEELKLETKTLNDNPEMLLRSIGAVAAFSAGDTVGDAPVPAILEAEEQDTNAALHKIQRLNPLKKMVFRFVLAQAKERIKQRENLRFLRTRVFGRVRKIFVELGNRLCDAGMLSSPQDVFYLEVEEVLSILEGTSTTSALATIVACRKTEFEAFRKEPDPGVRIITWGIPSKSTDKIRFAGAKESAKNCPTLDAITSDAIKGIPCSPGKVTGRVRIITDPSSARLEQGDIIVAKRTDPGWILLFPAAAGLLVEQGSLLSHSAIVSRELGLPAIVGVNHVTGLLHNGDMVSFDGKTGIIEIIERAESINVSRVA